MTAVLPSSPALLLSNFLHSATYIICLASGDGWICIHDLRICFQFINYLKDLVLKALLPISFKYEDKRSMKLKCVFVSILFVLEGDLLDGVVL